MDKMKLQNILLKLANDVLDLEKSGKTLGEPIDEAERAILGLLDKSLPSHKRQVHVEHGEIMPSVAQCKWYFDGYEQAIADVRKVVKETSNE